VVLFPNTFIPTAPDRRLSPLSHNYLLRWDRTPILECFPQLPFPPFLTFFFVPSRISPFWKAQRSRTFLSEKIGPGVFFCAKSLYFFFFPPSTVFFCFWRRYSFFFPFLLWVVRSQTLRGLPFFFLGSPSGRRAKTFAGFSLWEGHPLGRINFCIVISKFALYSFFFFLGVAPPPLPFERKGFNPSLFFGRPYSRPCTVLCPPGFFFFLIFFFLPRKII